MFKNRIDRYLIRAIDTVMVPPEHLPKTYEHLKQTIENLRLARTLATENMNHTIERNKEVHDVKAKDPNCVNLCCYTYHMCRKACRQNYRENGRDCKNNPPWCQSLP